MLKQIGISVEEKKLTFDKDSFMNADMKQVMSYCMYPKVYENYLEAKLDNGEFLHMGSDVFFHGIREGETAEIALKEGKIIICDRYIYTSIANMKARNYRNENWFYEVAKEIIKPDISFLAFVEPSIAISRIKQREEEKDRYLDESLLHRVTNEFLLLALQEDLKVIDSSTSSDITFEYIQKELDKYV